MEKKHLYYCSKYKSNTQRPISLKDIGLRTFIEIVPFKAQNFNIVSLIQFLDCLTEEFVCNFKSIYKNIISLSCCNKNNFNNNIQIFNIIVSNDLGDIHVYARDNIHNNRTLSVVTVDYEICIMMTPFVMEFHDCPFFTQDIWESLNKYKNSMLYTFANYIARKNSNFPIFIKYSFQSFLNKRTLRRRAVSVKGFDDFCKILLHLPGFVYIEFSSEKVQDDGYSFKFQDDNFYLKNIIWIMPWALDIIENYTHYLQIDASFKALKPYKFCIYHSIFYNASLPFALSIGPKENKYLYNLLFDGLSIFQLNEQIFEKKVVLSDLGNPIKKFCKMHSNIQYFCHRHIIQIFGPRSILGIWAARLLRCKNEINYIQEREYIFIEMDEYKKVNNSPLIGDDDQKMKNFEIMLKNISEVDQMPDKEQIIKSDYFIANWAIWIRADHHVARCSNHCEGFHGNINKKLPDSGIHSFKTGFTIIANYILNYISNYTENCSNSFKNKHNKMIEKVINILSKRPDNYLKCAQDNCQCGEDDFIESIYGIKFPCTHTILSNFCKSEIFIYAQENMEIDFQFLFILALKKLPDYKFEWNSFKTSIKHIERIVSLYESEKEINFNKETEKKLCFLINEFLKSFTYILPEFFDVNPNDQKYSQNNFQFKELKEKLVFKKKSETETLFTKSDDKKMEKFKLENLYDDDESFDSIISQCTEDLSLIKKNIMKQKQK